MAGTATTSSTPLDLALRLHRALAPSPAQASCFSPLSVSAALAVTAAGSAGTTRRELVDLLTPDGDLDRLRGEIAAATGLDEAVHGEEAAVLAVANTVWTRADIGVRERFRAELERTGDGAVSAAPFSADPERARGMINADVAETTRGLISELVPPGAVDVDTVAAIVNALYLRTSWRHPFPPHATAPMPFRGAGEVDTMRLSASLGYASAGGWQAVTLPAAGGVQAAVLLPGIDKDRDTLDAAEQDLDAGTLAALLDSAARTEVELYLPRFEVRSHASLAGALGTLGAGTMFTPHADFSPLTGDAPLTISDVLHEAVLRVDEKGLEGAAATAVMAKLAAARGPEPVVVRVDRPFLFLVRHAATGVVYFLARITQP